MQRPLTAALLLACAVALGGCDARQWFVCALGNCGAALDVFSPETPRELRAEARTRQVVLSWAANRDDASEYDIYRSTTRGRGFSKLVPLGAPRDQATVTFVDRTVENDVTYYYRVTAQDSSENESLPAEASATPRLGTLPEAPNGLAATATDTSIDLTWAAGASASPVTYRVFRAGPGETPAALSTTAFERFSDFNFAPGTTYRYSVVAVDRDGQQSAFSSEVTVVAHGSAAPRFITKWGTRGTGDNHFEQPVDVAVGPDGKVYVADAALHTVQRFSPSGDWERTYGIDGDPCDGALTHPTGLAVAGSTIYVTDAQIGQGIACVQTFQSNSGQPGLSFGSLGTGDGQFQEPTDVAVDADGAAYVTDDRTDEIVKFNAAHNFVTRFTPDDGAQPVFDVPYGIVLDAAGALYASSYSFGYIWVLASNGHVTRRLGHGTGSGVGQFSGAAKVALDRSGRHVYVADPGNDRIQAFSSTDGALYTAFGGHGSGDGQFDHPQGVAVDCQGNIYVADTGNHRIQKFGSGASVPCIGPPTARASAVRRPPGFSVRFTPTKSRRGKVKGMTERGARQRGTFTLTARGARDFRRGTWAAVFDVRAGRTVRAAGTMVARSRRRPAERLCLAFTTTLTPGAPARLRGTFTTLGGTRGAARLRLGGRFDQTVSGGKSWILKGTSSVGRHPRAALPTRCRRAR
jgi:DNA-binding beta-propeller fold protein YncE